MLNLVPESEAYLYWDPETIAWYPLQLQSLSNCPEDNWFIKPVYWQVDMPAAEEVL